MSSFTSPCSGSPNTFSPIHRQYSTSSLLATPTNKAGVTRDATVFSSHASSAARPCAVMAGLRADAVAYWAIPLGLAKVGASRDSVPASVGSVGASDSVPSRDTMGDIDVWRRLL